MKTQFCPICGPKASKKILYPQNFNPNQINNKVFSARRQPDRLHYQTVKCASCNLVFASSILDFQKISKLYQKSYFTYQDKTSDLTKTYGYYLKKLENYSIQKNRLLEIGCGNGFFLLEAKHQGYKQVWGVEPSLDAINKAPKLIQKKIKNSMFHRKLFAANSFDVICFFQTFDHISNPNLFLKDCYHLLKPGGLILAINHNIDSLQAKILKDKSPIIDIEHPYLYNRQTMKKIFEKNKFQVLKTSSIFNIYSLDYLFYLFPLASNLKSFLIDLVKSLNLDKIKLKVRLGNLMLIAKK